MKKILFFILLLTSISVSGQKKSSLVVSEVMGNVRYHNENGREVLKSGKTLCLDDVITVPSNSTVVLLEPKGEKMYTIKGIYSGTLENYINHHKESVTAVTKQYIIYLIAQILSNKRNKVEKSEDSEATVFRDLDDTDEPDSVEQHPQ